MSLKRWVVPDVDKHAAAQLAEDCEIHPFLALLLVSRGITDPADVAEFILGGEVGDDPFAFADIDFAVERIQRALYGNEKIAIYGDYDADGITATVLLYTFLRQKGANVVYYIPERENEGYGLHIESIDLLSKQGVSLIITVDNGVSAVDEIEHAGKLGIDVIVTDHHQPPAELPRAVAVVDPHRPDCGSRYKEYAGVGVAFKLACAIEGDSDTVLEKYGDLVAIGTLADVVPLTGENRKLVRAGLDILNSCQRPGIKALTKVVGMNGRNLSSTSVVFSLAPRINAAGRMDTPDLAARLLLTESDETAETLANQIQQCNSARQSAEALIIKEITEQIQSRPELLADRVLVLDGQSWHPGVIGIIASRMVERYGKPCILITTKDNEANGSGRSVRGFSLYDAVHACAQVLSRFGGHDMAAGLSLPKSNINEFRLRINEYAANTYPMMPVPELRMEFKLRPSQVDVEKLALISVLEPFGCGNPAPVFGLFGMRLDNIMPIGKGKHLRISVSRDNVRFSAVYFNVSCESFPFECGQTVNLVATLERNEYKGVVTPTVLIKDIRAADFKQDELIDALQQFDSLMRNDETSGNDTAKMMPDRAQIEKVYRFLRAKKGWKGSLTQLCFYLKDITYVRVLVILEMLRESSLIELKNLGEILDIFILPVDKKVDLTRTSVWNRLSCVAGKRVVD